MRIDVLSPLELSADDLAVWERLQDSSVAFANPFLSSGWPRALARAGGPDAERGRVAVVRDGAGGALGFLPARVGRRTAMPIGAPLSDYQALVAAPEVVLLPGSIMRAFDVDRLDLYNFLPRPQFAGNLHASADSMIADLSRGYEAYAQQRRAGGTDILQDAAKKKRKLEREHGPVRFTALSTSTADFDTLIAWKRAQYRATEQPDIFDYGWPLRVLQNAFAHTEPGFRAGLFTLHVGDRLIAAHLAALGRRVAHAWFIAHDHDYLRYSPGVLLFDEILRWAPRAGYRELDLGPGDYRFKQSLSSTTRRVAYGFLGRPSTAALVRGGAFRLRTAAETLPLGRVSQLPAKAMRRLDLMRGLGGRRPSSGRSSSLASV